MFFLAQGPVMGTHHPKQQSRVPAIHVSLQAKGSFPGGRGICFQGQGGKTLPRNKELRARRLSQPFRGLKNPSFWAEGPHRASLPHPFNFKIV